MTKQMTPLRRRMIDDMTIRNMSPSTQKGYAAAVANLASSTDALPIIKRILNGYEVLAVPKTKCC
jgi:hypothetical protein